MRFSNPYAGMPWWECIGSTIIVVGGFAIVLGVIGASIFGLGYGLFLLFSDHGPVNSLLILAVIAAIATVVVCVFATLDKWELHRD